MFGALEPWHVILILVAAFLLFGAKKMPDMARSAGQSLRIFKSEMRQMQITLHEEPVETPTPAPADKVS